MQFSNFSGILGTLWVPTAAGTDATVTGVLIPPYMGDPGSPPFIYKPALSASGAVPRFPIGRIHVCRVVYTNGDTAHTLCLIRPKNYTYVATANAANSTTLVMFDDPGVYSTNYKYPSNLTTGTAQVADNAIAANDWVCVQLSDGTFHLSKVASVSSLTLTLSTATPNVTGGGAGVGNIIYFFGTTGDKDPATGYADTKAAVPALSTTLGTSQAQYKAFDDPTFGVIHSLHDGDPLLFQDPGTTHLGTLEFISGVYARV